MGGEDIRAGYQYEGVLRQVLDFVSVEEQPCYRLPEMGDLVIGRDPATCQIVLDSHLYGGVSRRHACLRLAPVIDNAAPAEIPIWQICDLNSANGTFINGEPLQGCQTLHRGDAIVLSENGPHFVLDYRPLPAALSPQPTIPGTEGRQSQSGFPDSDLTLSQLLPIVSASGNLSLKAYLLPGVITVTFVILMFMTAARPSLFRIILGTYLGGAGYFFIYQICGKRKLWWVLLACMVSTMLLLISPVLKVFMFVFRAWLPIARPESGFFVQFFSFFFGAGLMEELLKALPVLFLYIVGRRFTPTWRNRIGIAEPLDGILLAAAAALGFTLVETLGYYAPGAAQGLGDLAGTQAGQLASLQLLIPRILGSVAGHMAYSGYFGYFIGLSALKRSKHWLIHLLILAVGWLTSSVIHALWNASAGTFGPLGLAFVGVLSYAFLIAAILKARELSPNRFQNFLNRSKASP
jgi:RsiW-degrading membrane proteinase PrsW (M82 family)